MGRVEDGEAALGAAEAALAEIDARISALQADREDALAGLAEQEARAAEQRAALVVELPEDLVALYDRQRTRYGIGAAPLRGTVSGGSNMALTGADLARVRAAPPDAVVLDSESGCILVRLPEGKAVDAQELYTHPIPEIRQAFQGVARPFLNWNSRAVVRPEG